MDTHLIDRMLSVHFDGVWDTLVPILSEFLDSAEAWLDREDEYHTTQVMTILVSFRSVAATFGCDPAENDFLALRYEKAVFRLVKWFESSAQTQEEKRKEWEMFAELARRLKNWESADPDYVIPEGEP